MSRDEWYAPGEIRYNRPQVIWLLGHLPTLQEGIWPTRSDESGYTDAPRVQHTRSTTGPHEVPCQIAAELDARLERTAQDGVMLKLIYTYGEDVFQVAAQFHVTMGEVERRTGMALRYCSGWRRKRYDYRSRRPLKTKAGR